jgi:hypothetical protein
MERRQFKLVPHLFSTKEQRNFMPSGCPSSSVTYSSGTCTFTPGSSNYSSPAPSGVPFSSYSVIGSSPSQSSESTTPPKKKIVVAYWGAGGHGPWSPSDPYWDGARWYRENILIPMQNQTPEFTIAANAFVQNDGNSALRQILAAVDQNGSHVISSDEVNAATVKIIGYSWGGISALSLAQKLNSIGLIRVGGPDSSPIQYRLLAPIKVDTLVLIDPVNILNWTYTGFPSNVQNFHNYYQTLGKNSQFTVPAFPSCAAGIDSSGYNWGDFGYAFSRKWKGITISGAPANSQVNVTTTCTNCFKAWQIPNLANEAVRLYGPKVNHTTIPLYVSDVVVPLMK